MTDAGGDLSRPPELWGGVECTVNRVGDRTFDQTEWSGHAGRPDDLDRIAELGVRTLRYPVLWERTAPDGEHCDWTWPDERLARLLRLGIRPILGLVHHGAGPRHTALTEPSFAEGLAAFARRVAERYPWAEWYTPVNEPLTTARFSGLYGVWHPHGRDGRTFLRCLLTQCRAVVLAMRAVRQVRPDARLVQTEDLGKTYARPHLAYQADFENERRWLTFDLLGGLVDGRHPVRGYFRFVGVPDADVDWFLDNPCPPDVLGINHYLTSERFLDDRVERYPPDRRGGNGRHAYADVEAVRVRPEGLAGPRVLLREAWERYRRPLAVTEAHLGCTREEQMRWLCEVWRAARDLRRGGIDVRAVTAWSMLGAHEWDSLVTRPHGHYEPGVFDVRGPTPRPTGLAAMVRQMAAGRDPDHPVLDAPGWWRRPQRLTYAPEAAAPAVPPPGRPLLIAGAGALAKACARLCDLRGLHYRIHGRGEPDAGALAEHEPWALVLTDGKGVSRSLRNACAARGTALLVFHFAGAALRGDPGLLVHTGPLFGPWDDDPLTRALQALRAGRRVAADAAAVAPTYLPDLVHASLDLLIDGERGHWRVANAGQTTWADFLREAARMAGLDPAGVEDRPAPAPPIAAFERSFPLPPTADALARYFRERTHVRVVPPALHRDGCDTPPPRPPAALRPGFSADADAGAAVRPSAVGEIA